MKIKILFLTSILFFLFGCGVEPYEDPPYTRQVPVEYIKSILIQENQVRIVVAYFVPETCWEFVRNEITHKNNIYKGIVYARRTTDGPCGQEPQIFDTEFIFKNLNSGTYTFEFDGFEQKIDTTIYIP